MALPFKEPWKSHSLARAIQYIFEHFQMTYVEYASEIRGSSIQGAMEEPHSDII